MCPSYLLLARPSLCACSFISLDTTSCMEYKNNADAARATLLSHSLGRSALGVLRKNIKASLSHTHMFSAPDAAVETSLQNGSASGENEMLITAFPVEVQEKLNEIDEDGSGALSCAELVHMVDMYHESKKTNKKMMYIIGGLLGLLKQIHQASQRLMSLF